MHCRAWVSMIEQALACVAAPSVSMQVLEAELQVLSDIDVSSRQLCKTMITTFMSLPDQIMHCTTWEVFLRVTQCTWLQGTSE